MGQQQVGERVGFVAGESPWCLVSGPEHETFLLVVVVVVAPPVVEAAAALGWHVVGVLVESVEVPLAHERAVVTSLPEGRGEGGNGRIEPLRDLHHAALVRVEPGQEGSTERRAPRGAGHREVEANSPSRQAVDVRSLDVGIAAVAQGLRPMRIAEHPDDVHLPARTELKMPVHPSIIRRGEPAGNPLLF